MSIQIKTARKNSGFTIVEMIVVVAIVVILSTIAIATLGNVQATARDTEREDDTAAIAAHLESIHESGLPSYSLGPTYGYPGTATLSLAVTATVQPFLSLGASNLRSPGVENNLPISLVAATNSTQTTAGVLPQPAYKDYIYQPLQTDGTLCTATLPIDRTCVKYNLYYKTEVGDVVKIRTSKHQ